MLIKLTSENIYTIKHGKNETKENIINRTRIIDVNRHSDPKYPETVIVVIRKRNGDPKGFFLDAKTRNEATEFIDTVRAWKYRFSN